MIIPSDLEIFVSFLEDKIPYFEFYSKFNGNGELMCTVQLDPLKGPISIKNWVDMENRYGCANDMAKSMTICFAKKGTKVGVYPTKPKPGAKGAEVYADKDMGNKCETIYKFEESEWYGDVKVNYISGTLSGQISSFDVTFGN